MGDQSVEFKVRLGLDAAITQANSLKQILKESVNLDSSEGKSLLRMLESAQSAAEKLKQTMGESLKTSSGSKKLNNDLQKTFNLLNAITERMKRVSGDNLIMSPEETEAIKDMQQQITELQQKISEMKKGKIGKIFEDSDKQEFKDLLETAKKFGVEINENMTFSGLSTKIKKETDKVNKELDAVKKNLENLNNAQAQIGSDTGKTNMFDNLIANTRTMSELSATSIPLLKSKLQEIFKEYNKIYQMNLTANETKVGGSLQNTLTQQLDTTNKAIDQKILELKSKAKPYQDALAQIMQINTQNLHGRQNTKVAQQLKDFATNLGLDVRDRDTSGKISEKVEAYKQYIIEQLNTKLSEFNISDLEQARGKIADAIKDIFDDKALLKTANITDKKEFTNKLTSLLNNFNLGALKNQFSDFFSSIQKGDSISVTFNRFAELLEQRLSSAAQEATGRVAELTKESEAGASAQNTLGQAAEANASGIKQEEANIKSLLTFIRGIIQAKQDVNNAKIENDPGITQAQQQYQAAQQALQGYTNGLANLESKQKALGNVQMAVNRWMGFYEVLNLTKRAINDIKKHIQELDTVMTKIAVVTNMSQDDLWGQIKQYSEIARQYGVAIKGAYEVSQIYYQQGLNKGDVMTLTNETLKMARISGLDYATAADYMTTAIRGFKLEMSQAAHVTDVFSALAAKTASSTEELAIAISKTAASAESVGASFEATTAMMATMIATTRESATNIGTALKSVISRYGEMTSDPSKTTDSEGEEMSLNRVDKALQSIGITIHDVNGQFRDFDDVILELGEKWDSLDKNSQRYVATLMAGNRQQSRFLALVSNIDEYKKALEIAQNSEDSGELQTLKTLDSIDAKIERMKVTIQEFYTSTGIQDFYKGILDVITNVVDAANHLPKIAGKFPALVLTIGMQIISTIKSVLSIIIAQLSLSITKARATLENGFNTMTQDAAKGGTEAGISWRQRFEAEISKIQANNPGISKLGAALQTSAGRMAAMYVSAGLNAAGSSLALIGANTYGKSISRNEDLIAANQTAGGALLSGAGGALSGAVVGLQMGSILGPYGMAIGAAVGGIASALPGIVSALNMSNVNLTRQIELAKKAEQSTKEQATKDKGQVQEYTTALDKLKQLEQAQYNSADAAKEYKDYMNQLADSYPALISSMDQLGNYTITSTTLENELAKARAQSAISTKIALDKEKERLEKEQASAQQLMYVLNRQTQAGSYENFLGMQPSNILQYLEDNFIDQLNETTLKLFNMSWKEAKTAGKLSKGSDDLAIQAMNYTSQAIGLGQWTVPSLSGKNQASAASQLAYFDSWKNYGKPKGMHSGNEDIARGIKDFINQNPDRGFSFEYITGLTEEEFNKVRRASDHSDYEKYNRALDTARKRMKEYEKELETSVNTTEKSINVAQLLVQMEDRTKTYLADPNEQIQKAGRIQEKYNSYLASLLGESLTEEDFTLKPGQIKTNAEQILDNLFGWIFQNMEKAEGLFNEIDYSSMTKNTLESTLKKYGVTGDNNLTKTFYDAIISSYQKNRADALKLMNEALNNTSMNEFQADEIQKLFTDDLLPSEYASLVTSSVAQYDELVKKGMSDSALNLSTNLLNLLNAVSTITDYEDSQNAFSILKNIDLTDIESVNNAIESLDNLGLDDLAGILRNIAKTIPISATTQAAKLESEAKDVAKSMETIFTNAGKVFSNYSDILEEAEKIARDSDKSAKDFITTSDDGKGWVLTQSAIYEATKQMVEENNTTIKNTQDALDEQLELLEKVKKNNKKLTSQEIYELSIDEEGVFDKEKFKRLTQFQEQNITDEVLSDENGVQNLIDTITKSKNQAIEIAKSAITAPVRALASLDFEGIIDKTVDEAQVKNQLIAALTATYPDKTETEIINIATQILSDLQNGIFSSFTAYFKDIPAKRDYTKKLQGITKQQSKESRGVELFGKGFDLEELNKWTTEELKKANGYELFLTRTAPFQQIFKEVNGKYQIKENVELDDYLNYLRNWLGLTLEEGSDALNQAIQDWVDAQNKNTDLEILKNIRSASVGTTVSIEGMSQSLKEALDLQGATVEIQSEYFFDNLLKELKNLRDTTTDAALKQEINSIIQEIEGRVTTLFTGLSSIISDKVSLSDATTYVKSINGGKEVTQDEVIAAMNKLGFTWDEMTQNFGASAESIYQLEAAVNKITTDNKEELNNLKAKVAALKNKKTSRVYNAFTTIFSNYKNVSDEMIAELATSLDKNIEDVKAWFTSNGLGGYIADLTALKTEANNGNKIVADAMINLLNKTVGQIAQEAAAAIEEIAENIGQTHKYSEIKGKAAELGEETTVEGISTFDPETGLRIQTVAQSVADLRKKRNDLILTKRKEKAQVNFENAYKHENEIFSKIDEMLNDGKGNDEIISALGDSLYATQLKEFLEQEGNTVAKWLQSKRDAQNKVFNTILESTQLTPEEESAIDADIYNVIQQALGKYNFSAISGGTFTEESKRELESYLTYIAERAGIALDFDTIWSNLLVGKYDEFDNFMEKAIGYQDLKFEKITSISEREDFTKVNYEQYEKALEELYEAPQQLSESTSQVFTELGLNLEDRTNAIKVISKLIADNPKLSEEAKNKKYGVEAARNLLNIASDGSIAVDELKTFLKDNTLGMTFEDAAQILKDSNWYYDQMSDAFVAADMKYREGLNELVKQAQDDSLKKKETIDWESETAKAVDKSITDMLIAKDEEKDIDKQVQQLIDNITSGEDYISIPEILKDFYTKFNKDNYGRIKVETNEQKLAALQVLNQAKKVSSKTNSKLNVAIKTIEAQQSPASALAELLSTQSITYERAIEIAEIFGSNDVTSFMVGLGFALDEDNFVIDYYSKEAKDKLTTFYNEQKDKNNQIKNAETVTQDRLDSAFKDFDKNTSHILEITQALQDAIDGTISGDNLELLQKIFGDNTEIKKLLTSIETAGANANGEYKFDVKEFLGKEWGDTYKDAKQDVIDVLLPELVQNVLNPITDAMDMVLNPQTLDQAYQFFTDYQKTVGKIDFNELFSQQEDGTLLLNYDKFLEYRQAKIKELLASTPGLTEEQITQYVDKQLETQAKQAVDITGFLSASNRGVGSKARKTLAQQLVLANPAMLGAKQAAIDTENANFAKQQQDWAGYDNMLSILAKAHEDNLKAIEEQYNVDAEEQIKIIENGGNAAVEILKQYHPDASAEEIETVYKAKINRYLEAMNKLDSLQVGSIITDKTIQDLLSSADFKFDANGVITTVGNLTKAYKAIYDSMKETGEKTVADLNSSYAKYLTSSEQGEIDAIAAMGDAMGMTYDTLGQILGKTGKNLEQWLKDNAALYEHIGAGKIRITDFASFANQQGWEEGSEEWLSAFNTYNESMVALNRQTEKSILEEVQNVMSAKGGDQINITYLWSRIGNEAVEALNEALSKYGGQLTNGILTIDNNANIVGIINEISSVAQQYGNLLPDEIAELADAVADALKSFVDLINKGIQGSLNNQDVNKMKTMAKNYLGIDAENLTFTQTAEGLKLSQESAIELYTAMKKVDALQASLTFDELSKSLEENNEHYKSVQDIMLHIEELQNKINEANAKGDSTKINQYQQELELAEQILAARSTTEDSSFDFMSNKIPSGQNNPLNYYNSWQKAIKTIQEGAKVKGKKGKTGYAKGFIDYQDFYNIATEMNRLAGLSGQQFKMAGVTLDGSMEAASELIQKGAASLQAVDTGELKVNLKDVGLDILGGANSLSDGVDAGIRSLAESQIKMLDSLISLLEAIVAMEELGDLDVDSDNTLSFEELGFKVDENGLAQFEGDGAKFQDAAQRFSKAIDKMGGAANEVKIAGHSLSEIANVLTNINISDKKSLQKALESLDLTGADLQQIFDTFYKLAKSDEWSAEGTNVAQMIQDAFADSGLDLEIKINPYKNIKFNYDNKDFQKKMETLFKSKDFKNNKNKVQDMLKRAQGDQSKKENQLSYTEHYQLNYLMGKITVKKGKNGKTEYWYNNHKYDSPTDVGQAIALESKTGASNIQKASWKQTDKNGKTTTIEGYKGTLTFKGIKYTVRQAKGSQKTEYIYNGKTYTTPGDVKQQIALDSLKNEKKNAKRGKVSKAKTATGQTLQGSYTTVTIGGNDITVVADKNGKIWYRSTDGKYYKDLDSMILANVKAEHPEKERVSEKDVETYKLRMGYKVVPELKNVKKSDLTQQQIENLRKTNAEQLQKKFQEAKGDKEKLADLEYEFGFKATGDESIETFQSLLDDVNDIPETKTTIVEVKTEEAQENADKLKSTMDAIEDKSITITAIDEAKSVLDPIIAALKQIKDKTITVTVNQKTNTSTTTTTSKSNTTVSIGSESTNAAAGNVALAQGTLMGELGPELVVSKGRYFVVGQNGAEFVNLDKDAIVFNHLQTQSLLKNGKAGRGKPQTNERNATSFATGNVNGGPALASASSALSALKQLRAMWQSLLDASVQDMASKAGSGGGGGGGGGKKNAAFMKEVERWYTLMQRIAQLEKDINYQEQLRNKIVGDRNKTGKQYWNSQRESLGDIAQEISYQKELAISQESYFKKRRAELNKQSGFSKLYTFDASGQLVYNDKAKLKNGKKGGLNFLSDLFATNTKTGAAKYSDKQKYNKLIDAGLVGSKVYDENGNLIEKPKKSAKKEEWDTYYTEVVKAFSSKMDSDKEEMQKLHDSIDDANEKVLELDQKRNEILQEMTDKELELEEKVMQAVQDSKQAQIDSLQKLRDATEKSNQRYLDGLNAALQREQNMYQKNESQNDLDKMRRQLAILQRSGGSASQIASLQNDIRNKEKDQYFDERQSQIDAIQKASDNQIKKMDEQIDIMQKTLDFQIQNGLLWKEVRDIMNQSPSEIASFIQNNTKDYMNKSSADLEQVMKEVKFLAEYWSASKSEQAKLKKQKDIDDEWLGGEKYNSKTGKYERTGGTKAALKKQYSDEVWKAAGTKAYNAYKQKYNETGDPKVATAATREVLDKEKNKQNPGKKDTGSNKNNDKKDNKKNTNTKKTANLGRYQIKDGKTKFLGWYTLKVGGKAPAAPTISGYTGKITYNSVPKNGAIAGRTYRVDYTYTKIQGYRVYAYVNLFDSTKKKIDYVQSWGEGTTLEAAKKKLASNANQMKGKTIKGKKVASVTTKIFKTVPQYKQGGLVNYTGIAQVDGTPSKPEAFLNAKQTEVLKKGLLGGKNSLVSVLADFQAMIDSTSHTSTSSNEPSIIIENATVQMNVQKINNDYDARRAGEQALEEMLKIARKTGATSVSRR